MNDETKPPRTVTVVGRAREQYGRITSDRYRLCQMEIAEPYPHVAFFGIEARDGRGIVEIIGLMEDADEVSIEFDVHDTFDGFDAVSPALMTTPDRITITRPGRTEDD